MPVTLSVAGSRLAVSGTAVATIVGPSIVGLSIVGPSIVAPPIGDPAVTSMTSPTTRSTRLPLPSRKNAEKDPSRPVCTCVVAKMLPPRFSASMARAFNLV